MPSVEEIKAQLDREMQDFMRRTTTPPESNARTAFKSGQVEHIDRREPPLAKITETKLELEEFLPGIEGGALAETPPEEEEVFYAEVTFNDSDEPAGIMAVTDATGWEALA